MKLYKSMKYIGAAVAAMSFSIGASLTMAIPVDFTDSDIRGSYYGLVYGADTTTPVGVLSLKLSKKGSFSARMTSSSTGDQSRLKGKIETDGSYSNIGEHRNADGVSSTTDMELMEAGSTYYRITGTFTAPDTSKQYFELRRGMYSRTIPTTLADRYTMLVPSLVTDSADIPAGNGMAYGQVKTNGKVSLKGYSNAGNKFSYSGIILEGDLLSFFTKPKNRDVESLVGMLEFRDIVGVSDLDGDLFHDQQISSKGGHYLAGYSQILPSFGSRYMKPASSAFPADGYVDIASNALASFTGGFHDATNYVFTWTPKGKMSAPKQPLYSTSSRMNNAMGYFSGQYNAQDADDGFSKSKSKLRGVVIQKQDLVSGQSITGGTISGRYTIEPNDSGEIAPTTFVTPRKKSVSASVASYVVRVFVESAWQVVIPEDSSWVDVDVTSGVGNGLVVVTIASNPTGLPREAKIWIAGLSHKIEQDFRDENGAVVGGVGAVTAVLSPAVITVSTLAQSYDVAVEADGDWDVSVPVGAGFIFATPSSGTGNGTVTVNISWNPFFFNRTGTVIIGGTVHRVTQTWF